MFKFHSITEIYQVAKRDLKIGFSKKTWDKIVIVLGFDRKKTPPYKVKYLPTPKATKPLQRLHLDITEFNTMNGTKVYISILMDNFSRKVLGWYAFYQKSAVNTKRCLSFLKQYELIENCELIVDGGSENNNKLIDQYLKTEFPTITKLIARKDVNYSNSMVEAFNKHLKYLYLFRTSIYSFEQLVKFLNFVMPHYNQKPKAVLKGKSPNEVFNMESYPIEIEDWNEHCQNEKEKRIRENKKFFCEKCQ